MKKVDYFYTPFVQKRTIGNRVISFDPLQDEIDYINFENN